MENKNLRSLNDLNHLLNLNYDETLNQGLIDNAYNAMKELADNIENTWEVYKDKGYYIDEDAFNMLNEVLDGLDQLMNQLKTEEEIWAEYYAEENAVVDECKLGLRKAFEENNKEMIEHYANILYDLGYIDSANRIAEEYKQVEEEENSATVEILMRFENALEMNNNMEMLECIEQMKEVDPIYVELMMNSMFEEDEE